MRVQSPLALSYESAIAGGQLVAQPPAHMLLPAASLSKKYSVIPCSSTILSCVIIGGSASAGKDMAVPRANNIRVRNIMCSSFGYGFRGPDSWYLTPDGCQRQQVSCGSASAKIEHF